jgi:hypothetical protein
MGLVCPVDADGCLVGKWRTNIHKTFGLRLGLEPQKARWHWLSKVVQSVRRVRRNHLRIRLTRNVTDLLDQLEGRPSGEVI